MQQPTRWTPQTSADSAATVASLPGPAGRLFGKKKKIMTSVWVDSRKRVAGTDSDFEFDVGETVHLQGSARLGVFKIRVADTFLSTDRGTYLYWHAFIEMSTLHHKTARLDSQKRRLLPLVMPASGIAEVDFTWCKVRDLAGLPIDLKDGPFFPAPGGRGQMVQSSPGVGGDIKMVAGSFAEARTSAGLDFSFLEGDYLDLVL